MSEDQITFEFHEVIKDLGNDNPVDGYITAKVIPGGIRIEGRVETDLIMECGRCLENYPYHSDVVIEEVFIHGSLSCAKEMELTEENFVEELKDRKEIDVTDLIYQTIILNNPSKKLCKEECSGPQDYQELQEEKSIDPRLEIFTKLYDQELSEKTQIN